MKRGFDLALSGAGLLVSWPVWLAFAAAIKMEDGGPIFYTQARVGRTGRAFRVLKFRSMVPDAEARVGARQASHGDPRIYPRRSVCCGRPRLTSCRSSGTSFEAT